MLRPTSIATVTIAFASLAILTSCNLSDFFQVSKSVSTRVVGSDSGEIGAEATSASTALPEWLKPLETPTIPSPTNGPQDVVVQETQQEEDGYLFAVQGGSPRWLQNFSRRDAGCNWMGIAGQVFDLDGKPVTPLVVEVGGTLDGQTISMLAVTGVASDYGPAGFEFTLSDRVTDSGGSLWIQLFDLQGRPRSARVPFDTYGDCGRNLVVMNFVELDPDRISRDYYLPFVVENTELESLPSEVDP